MKRSVGVIGCGAIVRQIHLPVLLSLPGIQVKWLLDKDVARARQLAAISGVESVEYTDDFARLPPVDIVLIATPWGPRQTIYEQLDRITWPKPALYVEKPFARSLSEHKAIQARYAPHQVAAGLLRRSFCALQCVRKLGQDGVFGNLIRLEVRYGGAGRILTRGGYSSNLEIAGGGTLFEMGIHYLDAALYCTQAAEVAVVEKRLIYHEGFDVHVNAHLAITDSVGRNVPFLVRVSNFEHMPQAIELTYETAAIELDISGLGQMTVRGRGANASRAVLQVSQEFGPTHSLAMAARHWELFLEALDTQSINLTSSCTSEVTTMAVEAIYDHRT